MSWQRIKYFSAMGVEKTNFVRFLIFANYKRWSTPVVIFEIVNIFLGLALCICIDLFALVLRNN
jgi:hypothetical protein